MKYLKWATVMAVFFIAWIFIYTFLHEGGHALVAIMYGGHIDKMVLGLNAHVMYSGTSFSQFGEALVYVSGAFLPVLVVLIAIIIYKQNIKNKLYHICYGIVFISVISSILVWVIMPPLSFLIELPAGDDVTKFINYSGINPIIIALCAMLVIMLMVLIAYKKKLFISLKKILGAEKQESKPGKREKLIWRLVIINIVLILTVLFILLKPAKPVLEFNYEGIVNNTENVLVVPLKIDKSKDYRLELDLKGKGFITDMRICDEEGKLVYQNFSETLTLQSQLKLNKGIYKISFTYLLEPEKIDDYFLTMGYDIEPGEIKKLFELFKYNQDNEHSINISMTIH